MRKPVEIVKNAYGSYSVIIYGIEVFRGTYEECLRRVALE